MGILCILKMCKIMEEYGKECAEEAKVATKTETARRMLADGLNNEKVAQYSGLPIEEVQKLAAGN